MVGGILKTDVKAAHLVPKYLTGDEVAYIFDVEDSVQTSQEHKIYPLELRF